MADSFSKKENLKKKLQKQKEKSLKREERKTNNNKGKNFEELFQYVDANGQLTDVKPEDQDRQGIDLNEIQLGAAPIEVEEKIQSGIITFYSEKGYGFITEDGTKDNIFFHENNCAHPVKKGNKVSFDKEKSPKGFVAVNIQIIK